MAKKLENTLDNMIWSFSRINSYDTCPKMFYLTYIEEAPKLQNAFAQWGTWGHHLLELYYKGELELFELSGEYESGYKDNITIPFPDKFYDLTTSYWEAGKEYFDNFEDDFEDYEIVGVEQKILTKVGDYDFVGYIDLILKDEKGYYICDHKSKGKFKSKAEFRHYLFQLYIYSKYIYETYGEYPVGLIFNMFRTGKIEKVKFNLEEYNKALNWATSTIEQIYEDEKFDDKVLIKCLSRGKSEKDIKDSDIDFFDREICSVRNDCSRCKKYLTT